MLELARLGEQAHELRACRRTAHGVRSAAIERQARSVRATAVSVGLAVPAVGKTLEPTTYRFEWSCARPLLSTTELAGSSPIRQVPMMWPAPLQSMKNLKSVGEPPIF